MRPKMSFLLSAFLLMMFGKIAQLGHFANMSWGWICLPAAMDVVLNIFVVLDKERHYIDRFIIWTKERKLSKIKKQYFNHKN